MDKKQMERIIKLERKTIANRIVRLMIFALTACMIACTGNTSNKEPNDSKPNDKLKLGDRTYTFHIGEISHEDGITIVQLLGDGQPIQMKGSFNSAGDIVSLVSPVMMSITVKGETIGCDKNNIVVSGSNFIFRFPTSELPDKIIIYSNNDKKSTVVFDAKTKEVTDKYEKKFIIT